MAKNSYAQNRTEAVLPERQIAVTNGAAARMLGISPRTLANWRAQGRGPRYVKVGSHRSPALYRVSDIEAWIDSHLVERSDVSGDKASGAARG